MVTKVVVVLLAVTSSTAITFGDSEGQLLMLHDAHKTGMMKLMTQAFASIDQDHDGQVSKPELIRALLRDRKDWELHELLGFQWGGTRQSQREELKRYFKAGDTNHDQKLSPHEMIMMARVAEYKTKLDIRHAFVLLTEQDTKRQDILIAQLRSLPSLNVSAVPTGTNGFALPKELHGMPSGNYFLIEDDVMLRPDWWQELSARMEFVPADWDILVSIAILIWRSPAHLGSISISHLFAFAIETE
jgi:Ca2+-binding EF-hand superfamily protein